MEILQERRYLPWRERMWALVRGPEVLEVGVGTGKNFAFYPKEVRVTGVDLTPGMLDRARKRAVILKRNVTLLLGDTQNLNFPDSSFDSVVATFVFCSVSDPMLGLRELGRVVKPDGQIFLMEHVRSGKQVVGEMMEILNPVVVRVTGANINRRTVENVYRSGLMIDRVNNLGMGDIFKLIIARRKK
ncbi:MAG: class I SAM-dependent methyltransferase [Anaerolineales bacterium]|nr:class I SAM-dependent methyltransferase [Anaerolineales bacterium]